jgi:hypothetical protein
MESDLNGVVSSQDKIMVDHNFRSISVRDSRVIEIMNRLFINKFPMYSFHLYRFSTWKAII